MGTQVPFVVGSRHSSELMTLLMFLVGANTIARFIISEYSLVKKKAESMDAYHSDRAKKKASRPWRCLSIGLTITSQLQSGQKWRYCSLLPSC